MIDTINRILCMIIAALPTIAIVVLSVSLYKDIHNFNTELEQQNINRIKKEAYKEILKSLDDKLSDCAVMSDGEYCGYYCSDVRDVLRELEDEYEIHS